MCVPKGLEFSFVPRAGSEFNLSSLWDVPQYLIMAFSLALDAPVEKASRVSFTSGPAIRAPALQPGAVPDEAFWLRSVKLAGPHSDILSAYGARIFVTSSGRYYVPAESDRTEILALRRNGEVATRVLSAATLVLHKHLEQKSGRAPPRGALLIAHLAGEKTALDYMAALHADPEADAAAAVPALAKLLDEVGKALTLAQLEARLSRALLAKPEQIAEAQTQDQEKTFKGTLTKPDLRTAAPARVAGR